MSRLRLFDRLQTFQYHLLDVSWSLTIPPFALNPLFGFSSITAPEMTIETQEVAEGNHWFKRHVISGGSVTNIVLQRGTTFYESEFWVWFKATLRGQHATIPTRPLLSGKRRNLMLIQYTGYSMEGANNVSLDIAQTMSASLGFLPTPNAVLAVPGRAWMLLECMPVRYKAASDFDATSGAISIAEIELSVDRWEEIAVAA